MEACAVLEDSDEFGGPEENMLRLGVLNNEGWFIEGVGEATWVELVAWVEEVRSNSGAELG